MSAAPAKTRHPTAMGRDRESPSPVIATPHIKAAITTAAPRRCTFRVQPLKTVMMRLPTLIPEYEKPIACAPPHCTASAGNTAIGIAKVRATMSTT
jgi:hypothetical protein